MVFPVPDPFPSPVFMIFLWFFKSSSCQGFCVCWLLFLLWLEQFFEWSWAFHCWVGWLLFQVLYFPQQVDSLFNCVIASSVNFFTVLFSCFDFGFCVWSFQCYEPVIWYIWSCYEWSILCCRCDDSVNVCPRLYVGMMTCCFKLKADIVLEVFVHLHYCLCGYWCLPWLSDLDV